MSEVALLNAVEKTLQAALNDPRGDRVRRSFEGQPFPHSGQWFIGIAESGFSNQDMNAIGLDEVYSVRVVMTFKMAYAPKRSTEELFSEQDHFRDITRKIITALHQRWEVINLANEKIGDAANGFVEALRFSNASTISTRDASWIWAEAQEHAPSVYVRELLFTGARRVQTLDDMT